MKGFVSTSNWLYRWITEAIGWEINVDCVWFSYKKSLFHEIKHETFMWYALLTSRDGLAFSLFFNMKTQRIWTWHSRHGVLNCSLVTPLWIHTTCVSASGEDTTINNTVKFWPIISLSTAKLVLLCHYLQLTTSFTYLGMTSFTHIDKPWLWSANCMSQKNKSWYFQHIADS